MTPSERINAAATSLSPPQATSEEARRPGPARGRATVRVVIVGLTLMLFSAFFQAGAAQADVYAGRGWAGWNSVPNAPCQAVSGGVRLTAQPPYVKSPDFNIGQVDSTWARYKVYLVDAYTGATISSSNWSGWLLTYDNRVTTWTGSAAFTTGSSWYYLDYRIEWWIGNNFYGWQANRVTSYYYYDLNGVLIRNLQQCYRYTF